MQTRRCNFGKDPQLFHNALQNATLCPSQSTNSDIAVAKPYRNLSRRKNLEHPKPRTARVCIANPFLNEVSLKCPPSCPPRPLNPKTQSRSRSPRPLSPSLPPWRALPQLELCCCLCWGRLQPAAQKLRQSRSLGVHVSKALK